MDELEVVPDSEEVRGLSPLHDLPEVVKPPGSKSLAIRALLAAGLAEGETHLQGIPPGDDVAACVGALRACGVLMEPVADGGLLIKGRSPAAGLHWNAESGVQCGESGTLARMLTAVLGFCGEPDKQHRIEVSGSLRQRHSDALLAGLREGGVQVQEDEDSPGSWPLILKANAGPQTLMLQNPSSSQELSGLLLAFAAHDAGPRGRSVLVMGGLPSEPYAAMTAATLRGFGADAQGAGAEWRVRGPLLAPAEPLSIETDASGAAVALAAACLLGRRMRVPGFQAQSLQGDVAILKCLAAFGCEVERTPTELVAGGFPTGPAQLDLSATPDLAPVLAAVAGAYSLQAGAQASPSTLWGLETLNGKECERIKVLAGALRALGIETQETGHSLIIGPSQGLGPAQAEPLTLDPEGDHRMAFAFSLLGLVRPNLRVSNAGCVAKSWPTFWEDMGCS